MGGPRLKRAEADRRQARAATGTYAGGHNGACLAGSEQGLEYVARIYVYLIMV